jgi:hypothetical protein
VTPRPGRAQPNRNASRCTISTYTGRRRRAAAGVRGGCAKFSSSAHPMTRLSSSPFGFPPRRVSCLKSQMEMQLNAPPCGAWQRRACVPSPVLEARCPVETWHAGLGLGATRPETIRLFFIPNPRRQRPVSRCHHQRPAAAQRQTVDISPRRMETVHMMFDGQMASDLAVSRSTQYGRSGVYRELCSRAVQIPSILPSMCSWEIRFRPMHSIHAQHERTT